MGIISKIVFLLGQIQPEDIARLPPAHRKYFADVLEYWAKRVNNLSDRQQSGILLELRRRGCTGVDEC